MNMAFGSLLYSSVDWIEKLAKKLFISSSFNIAFFSLLLISEDFSNITSLKHEQAILYWLTSPKIFPFKTTTNKKSTKKINKKHKLDQFAKISANITPGSFHSPYKLSLHAKNSSMRLPSTFMYLWWPDDECFTFSLCFLHLVTITRIEWFGPQRHSAPRPRAPVRPIGFLNQNRN